MLTTYTPTPELLALDEAGRIKWAEALESGEYTQGFTRLFRDGKCCPLAVLALANGVAESLLSSADRYQHIPNLGCDDIFHLQFAIQSCSLDHFKVWDLNDNHRLTFPQIAQLLRGNPVSVR